LQKKCHGTLSNAVPRRHHSLKAPHKSHQDRFILFCKLPIKDQVEKFDCILQRQATATSSNGNVKQRQRQATATSSNGNVKQRQRQATAVAIQFRDGGKSNMYRK
jgi:hypothetical protein